MSKKPDQLALVAALSCPHCREPLKLWQAPVPDNTVYGECPRGCVCHVVDVRMPNVAEWALRARFRLEVDPASLSPSERPAPENNR